METLPLGQLKLPWRRVHSLTKRNGNIRRSCLDAIEALVHSLTKRNGNNISCDILAELKIVHSLTKRNGNKIVFPSVSVLSQSSQPN